MAVSIDEVLDRPETAAAEALDVATDLLEAAGPEKSPNRCSSR